MFSILTQIHQWKKWEDLIADESFDPETGTKLRDSFYQLYIQNS